MTATTKWDMTLIWVATQTTANAVVYFFRLTAYYPGGENLENCTIRTFLATENCKSYLKNFFTKPLDNPHPLCYNKSTKKKGTDYYDY